MPQEETWSAQGENYRIAQNFRGAKFSRICNFLNFAETIFADAVNVTPNVHNYTKNFAVGGRSSKNVEILRYTIYLFVL